MDIVELVKEKLGSVIFGDVSITVGGDIVNVYCRHCVGDVKYGDKTYREWDVYDTITIKSGVIGWS